MQAFNNMTKENRPNIHVLIPAAGEGSRLGGPVPKAYRKIAGKAILAHTLEKFAALPNVASITILTDPAHKEWLKETLNTPERYKTIPGGKTRKESVYNGLKSLSNAFEEDFVLIHDAARPLIRPTDMESVIKAAMASGAATLAVPVSDTLRRDNGETVDREKLWAVQTPQVFRLSLIRAAHEQTQTDENYTDDAGLLTSAGHPVTIVPGHKDNFKITTEDDLHMAEILLTPHMETRTGMGFDVHAFAGSPAQSLRLGGIDIPHTQALSGHSDADVALHALTDALLGTLAAGDIGTHFPPSDPQWRGADSTIFLKTAADMVTDRGGQIIHTDLTIICETPKIGPHRTAIQSRIADLLNLSPDRISIKATTTEKLGFTGRGEGIAAQAIATIRLPVEE